MAGDAAGGVRDGLGAGGDTVDDVVDRMDAGLPADGPHEDETARYVSDIADEVVAESAEAPFTALMRSPSGRLVPVLPLTEAFPTDIRPFHRPRNAEPSPRWIGVFLAACAVLFVPYIVQLAMNLPSRVSTHNYDAAWVGLDVMELLALAATAFFVWTRSTWVAISASVAATLLVCDVWFDVLTAHDAKDRTLAIVEAVVLELPMAAFCLWIARHAEVVADRATRLLLRRSARQAALLRDITAELEL